jgi:MftR C-terminal domain
VGIRHPRTIADAAIAIERSYAHVRVEDIAAAQRRLHASIEAALAAAIADRTGTDAARDLYPRLVAGVAVSATQTAFDHWRASDSTAPFPGVLREVLRHVAAGLPAASPPSGAGGPYPPV